MRACLCTSGASRPHLMAGLRRPALAWKQRTDVIGHCDHLVAAREWAPLNSSKCEAVGSHPPNKKMGGQARSVGRHIVSREADLPKRGVCPASRRRSVEFAEVCADRLVRRLRHRSFGLWFGPARRLSPVAFQPFLDEIVGAQRHWRNSLELVPTPDDVVLDMRTDENSPIDALATELYQYVFLSEPGRRDLVVRDIERIFPVYQRMGCGRRSRGSPQARRERLPIRGAPRRVAERKHQWWWGWLVPCDVRRGRADREKVLRCVLGHAICVLLALEQHLPFLIRPSLVDVGGLIETTPNAHGGNNQYVPSIVQRRQTDLSQIASGIIEARAVIRAPIGSQIGAAAGQPGVVQDLVQMLAQFLEVPRSGQYHLVETEWNGWPRQVPFDPCPKLLFDGSEFRPSVSQIVGAVCRADFRQGLRERRQTGVSAPSCRRR